MARIWACLCVLVLCGCSSDFKSSTDLAIASSIEFKGDTSILNEFTKEKTDKLDLFTPFN
jgi:hypothetical protein